MNTTKGSPLLSDDLADFLLARIAEDEAVAVDCAAVPMGYSWRTISWMHGANREHGRRHDPARVLAECGARRRIVEAHQGLLTAAPQVDGDELARVIVRSGLVVSEGILRLLAAPYSDHPDYRDEWRPV